MTKVAEIASTWCAALAVLEAADPTGIADAQREHHLHQLAFFRGELEGGFTSAVLGAEQRLEFHLALDRVECRLRGLSPMSASLKALERLLDHARQNPSADGAQRLIAEIDGIEDSDDHRALSRLNPEVYAASCVRLAALRREAEVQLTNAN